MREKNLRTTAPITQKSEQARTKAAFKRIIGKRLRHIRNYYHETMTTLAAVIDPPVSAQAVRLWETGSTSPSPENMNEIANFYDVSLDYLWCREFSAMSSEELERVPEKKIARMPATAAKEFTPTTAAVDLRG